MDESTEAPPGSGGFRTFVCLWLAQVLSTLGSGFTTFGLGVWVYQQTGSATQYALISFFTLLPGLLVAPMAGALVDRLDRRLLLILCDGMSGVSTLALLYLFSTGSLETWHIYTLGAINSTFTSLQMPAFTASVSLLVGPRQLGRAAGMSQVGDAASRILAPLGAGALMAQVSLLGLLVIDLASLVLAILTLAFLKIPNPSSTATEASQTDRPSLFEDAREGMRYIAERPGMLALLLMVMWVNFALGIVQTLLAPLVLSMASPKALGMVLSVSAVGLLVGGLVMAIWGGPARRIPMVFLCVTIQAIVLWVAGLSASVPMLAACSFGFMLAMAIQASCSTAFWQSKVPPQLQGRVFALRSMVGRACLPLAFLVGGPLAEKVLEPLVHAWFQGSALDGSEPGIRLLFVVMGVWLVGVLAAGYSYPRLRRVEDELPDMLPDSAD